MYKDLPRGTKLSITYSVKKAFILYMESIEWDEDAYNSDEFLRFWRQYSDESAQWTNEVDQTLLENSEFQEDLTKKVNEIIKKIFETAPTEDQMNKIDELVQKLGIEDVDYSCQAEADYHIERLSKQA
ncbi:MULTISPECIES: CotH kinase family protein [Alkalihalophilus]|uniref:CotH kinase family protein n=1 Tax=Alkalihalophilus TaxID=2893060 RepID=UPI00259BAB32|nr:MULTISPECIES: hypothetical protein [Alkalihalophilus]MEC2071326.1 hypothetical protein [Alkalihalophilus marmarensis]WEG16631.1 hypothetical protein PQ478_19330 [Alkalihalophilus pseudofirmus]